MLIKHSFCFIFSLRKRFMDNNEIERAHKLLLETADGYGAIQAKQQ